jgi:hypothetical protein
LGLLLAFDALLCLLLFRVGNAAEVNYSWNLLTNYSDIVLAFTLRLILVPWFTYLAIQRGSPKSVIVLKGDEDFDDILWQRRKLVLGYLFILTTISQVLLGIRAVSFDSLESSVSEQYFAALLLLSITVVNLELWQADKTVTALTTTEGILFQGLHVHPLHYKPNGMPRIVQVWLFIF